MAVALPKHEFSGNMNELDETVDTMIVRSENLVRHGTKETVKAYVCQVCGKEGDRGNIRSHLEVNHFEEISIQGKFLDTTSRDPPPAPPDYSGQSSRSPLTIVGSQAAPH